MSIVKRLLLAAGGGVIITSSLIAVEALAANAKQVARFVASLLDWPLTLVERLPLCPDCYNADSISDKLNCLVIFLSADVLAYALLIYILLALHER